MQRFCPCGKPIKPTWTLCQDCLSQYGKDRDKWPQWLREWLQSYQSELDQERRHNHLQIDIDGEIIEPPKVPKLKGCRNQTHLYQDRDKY